MRAWESDNNGLLVWEACVVCLPRFPKGVGCRNLSPRILPLAGIDRLCRGELPPVCSIMVEQKVVARHLSTGVRIIKGERGVNYPRQTQAQPNLNSLLFFQPAFVTYIEAGFQIAPGAAVQRAVAGQRHRRVVLSRVRQVVRQRYHAPAAAFRTRTHLIVAF